MASLALFDLDGTLTDPVPGLISCHRHALEQIHLDFDQLVDSHQGAETSELIRLPASDLYVLLNVPADEVERASQRFREHRVVAGWVEDVLYPGIDELLSQLTDAGWRIGVATNQLEPLAIRILDRLELTARFEFVVGSDTARTRKTKSQIISHAMSSLSEPVEGTAVIADRAVDVTAAKSMQMTSIGAAWGFGSIEELMGADADAVAVAPADVAELLLGDS